MHYVFPSTFTCTGSPTTRARPRRPGKVDAYSPPENINLSLTSNPTNGSFYYIFSSLIGHSNGGPASDGAAAHPIPDKRAAD